MESGHAYIYDLDNLNELLHRIIYGRILNFAEQETVVRFKVICRQLLAQQDTAEVFAAVLQDVQDEDRSAMLAALTGQ
jgi:hypothetical protein